MCGIVGYIGSRNCQDILLNGLKRLEYRGYDSAGIAVFTEKGLQVSKTKGRLSVLAEKLKHDPLYGTAGIGHTRWATHGQPSDENAHPHTDEKLNMSVVHNGIIENYLSIKEELVAKGYHFSSDTDSEVIAHLLKDLYDGDLVSAVQKAVKKMRGAYALAVLSADEPDKLIAVRIASPLIIGAGKGENFVASDIPAIIEHTRDVYILNEGEMAIVMKDRVELKTVDGKTISREINHVEWDIETAEKAGYDHFMLKEIHEQPRAYKDTFLKRIDETGKVIKYDEVGLTAEELRNVQQIHIIGCGTAYHAGLVGRSVIEQYAQIPVLTDIASEYRYRNPIITDKTLVIAVSQSGETADTLAALRYAKNKGAKVIAITNVVGSTIAREADYRIITMAGPEISVASTKAYTTQLMEFYLLGLHIANLLGRIDETVVSDMVAELQQLPAKVQAIFDQTDAIKELADKIASHENMFFVGRGLDYAVAMEGSLKLKETSYIHSEAYAAGELKHGTLALITDGIPIIALVTQEGVREKTINNIVEMRARGAYVIAIGIEGDEELAKSVDEVFYIPSTNDMLAPALSVIPLQLLAYHTSLARGNDVDKPRNLAKSVTVE